MRSNVVATKPRPLGRCGPNAQEQVTTERQGIVIEPANPEFIYPPVYSPAVYGPWPYPDYPPLDISPDDYGVGFPLPLGIGFGVGFAVVQPLWRWCAFDWAQELSPNFGDGLKIRRRLEARQKCR
jgi:hypothetical protein